MGMRAPRALIAVCVAALVAVAAACALWVTDTARSSIREQFVAREETAATERAAQVADAVAVARDRLRSLSALPGLTTAVARGDRAFLQPAVVAGTRANTILTLAITTPNGEVLAHSPADKPAVMIADGDTRLEPVGD